VAHANSAEWALAKGPHTLRCVCAVIYITYCERMLGRWLRLESCAGWLAFFGGGDVTQILCLLIRVLRCYLLLATALFLCGLPCQAACATTGSVATCVGGNFGGRGVAHYVPPQALSQCVYEATLGGRGCSHIMCWARLPTTRVALLTRIRVFGLPYIGCCSCSCMHMSLQ
jgi:hypothetical protein